jgi:curved DNA-binding protein CbpA
MQSSSVKTTLQNAMLIFKETAETLTPGTLKTKFRELVLKYHPDRGGDSATFDYIVENYRILESFLQTNTVPSMERTIKDIQYERKSNDSSMQRRKQNSMTSMDTQRHFNIERFNDVYDSNRIKNASDKGYLDWLQKDDPPTRKPNGVTDANFNESFSRYRKQVAPQTTDLIVIPEAFQCSSTSCGFSYLGEDEIKDFTSSTASAGNLHYVDLKKAHTETLLIDPDTVKERKQYRNVDEFRADRSRSEKDTLTPEEKEYLAYKKRQEEYEEKFRKARIFEKDQEISENYNRVTTLMLQR